MSNESESFGELAPAGTVFVCGACGKTSKTRYPRGEGSGWDVSCMLNAVLCEVDSLVDGDDGRVMKADAVKGWER